ncbi:MAG: hypothetical protein AB1640_11825 [bacterium]
MIPEPSVPFYGVLSVYIPLVLVAYLAVFLSLSAMVRCLTGLAAILHRQGRDRRGPRSVRVTPEPETAAA